MGRMINIPLKAIDLSVMVVLIRNEIKRDSIYHLRFIKIYQTCFQMELKWPWRCRFFFPVLDWLSSDWITLLACKHPHFLTERGWKSITATHDRKRYQNHRGLEVERKGGGCVSRMMMTIRKSHWSRKVQSKIEFILVWEVEFFSPSTILINHTCLADCSYTIK